MSIQSDKSSWRLASLRQRNEDFQIKYNDGIVLEESKVIGLGVVLDYRMSMNAHPEHLRERALTGAALLQYAAAKNVTQASLYKLMKATVCSRLLTLCASNKATDGLQHVDNQTMRLVTGAANGTSSTALRYWLGIHSIRDRQKIIGAKELMRAATTDTHQMYQEIGYREDELTTRRLATVRSWVCCARDIIDAICPIENIKDGEWIHSRHDSITTDALGSGVWRERAGEMNNAIVREVLETKAPTVVIATDCSVRNNVTVWGGAAYSGGQKIYEWSAGRHGKSSSFRSECESMDDALAWLGINSTR
jgi:hypothetical protein